MLYIKNLHLNPLIEDFLMVFMLIYIILLPILIYKDPKTAFYVAVVVSIIQIIAAARGMV